MLRLSNYHVISNEPSSYLYTCLIRVASHGLGNQVRYLAVQDRGVFGIHQPRQSAHVVAHYRLEAIYAHYRAL